MEGLGYSYITTTHPASTTIGPRSPSPWISCLHRGSSRHLQSVWGRDVASILVAVVGRGAQRRGYGAKHTTCPAASFMPNPKNHFLLEEDWLYTRLRRPYRNPSCRHLFLIFPNTKNVASLAAFFVSEFFSALSERHGRIGRVSHSSFLSIDIFEIKVILSGIRLLSASNAVSVTRFSNKFLSSFLILGGFRRPCSLGCDLCWTDEYRWSRPRHPLCVSSHKPLILFQKLPTFRTISQLYGHWNTVWCRKGASNYKFQLVEFQPFIVLVRKVQVLIAIGR